MKLRHLLLFAFLSLVGDVSYAQELKVTSFNRLDCDLLAHTTERKDLNGVPSAIVRVSVRGGQEHHFTGNVIGDMVYTPDEVQDYMIQDSRNATITSDNFGSLQYQFPERRYKKLVTKLSKSLMEDANTKRRTLVMPVVGIGKATSYGIMLGVVKKTGGYLKVKYNFKNVSGDYECDIDGCVASAGTTPWYNGESMSSRCAVTAGVLRRLIQRTPIYMYGGLGYGFKKLGWQMANGQWAENVDASSRGMEVDLGALYRMKNLALSAGVQTNQFKYWEASVGFGIMF